MLDNDLLVGSTDIIARLGLRSRKNLHYYITNDPTFPRPLGTIGPATLWTWPDIEAWAATKTFRKSNPPVHAPRSRDFQAAMVRLGEELEREPQDLVGCYEIAHRLKFTRTMDVHRLMRDKTSGFPKAVARIDPSRATWIWWWPDVEKWADEHDPDRIKAWREILLADDSAGNDNGTSPAPTKQTQKKKSVGATAKTPKKTPPRPKDGGR